MQNHPYKLEDCTILFDSEALRVVARPDNSLAIGALNKDGYPLMLEIWSELKGSYAQSSRWIEAGCYLIEVPEKYKEETLNVVHQLIGG